jgi:hypothetical protein
LTKKLSDFLIKTAEDVPRRRYLPMRSTSFAVSLLMVIFSSLTSSQTSQQTPAVGRVTGTVVDESSQPINQAQVCSVVYLVLKPNRSQSNSTCVTHTDETGQFEIDHLPMGTYTITASKNDDGYAELGQGTPMPEVTLTPEQPLASVIVKLGPKQGILIPVVKDNVTGKPVFDFFLKWQTDVPDGRWSGAAGFSQWTTRTPIPVEQDVSLEFSAHGYKSWVYADPTGSRFLRMQSGEREILSIGLQPEAKAR